MSIADIRLSLFLHFRLCPGTKDIRHSILREAKPKPNVPDDLTMWITDKEHAKFPSAVPATGLHAFT